MKLIVQIPCHNEAEHLPATLAAIPRQVDGIDTVEILVVDDGSDDGTGEVARQAGADHVVRFAARRGLALAFKGALAESLRRGADVIVNTDGDNQYEGADIPKLVAPILAGDADIVIGDRDPGSLPHFSALKRLFQRIGSWAMRRLSGTDVSDAPSGFRAYSREAALQLNVVTEFTYTLETLIWAGKHRMAVVDVPIRVHPTDRSSRLARTMGHYLAHATGAMARAYALYEPLKIFAVLGLVLSLAGVSLGARFVYLRFILQRPGSENIQSLILAAILSIVGFLLLCVAILADLLATNRRLLEEALYRVRKLELEPGRQAAPRRAAADAARPAEQGGADGSAQQPSAEPAGAAVGLPPDESG